MNDFGLHPEAYEDLEKIWDHIAQNASSFTAIKVNNTILDAITALVRMPHQGHKRPDLTSRPLRFITVYDYLIAYAPDESPLWVIAVLHGKRSPQLIASLIEDRSAA